MTGHLLPFWGWLLILAAILVIASIQHSIYLIRQQKLIGGQNGEGSEDLLRDKYWSERFDMPVMNVFSFAELLGTHKASEYNNNHGFYISTSDVRILGKQVPERNKILFALKQAAKGKIPIFLSNRILLANMTDDEIMNGYKVERGPFAAFKIRGLADIEINPRKALEWFIKTSTYTDLLPESLRTWWDSQLKKQG